MIAAGIPGHIVAAAAADDDSPLQPLHMSATAHAPVSEPVDCIRHLAAGCHETVRQDAAAADGLAGWGHGWPSHVRQVSLIAAANAQAWLSERATCTNIVHVQGLLHAIVWSGLEQCRQPLPCPADCYRRHENH